MSAENFKVFKSADEMVEKLAEYGTLRKLEEGDVILQEDAYIRSIPIVVKGSIKVMRTEEDGRELLIYYIKPGESCIMSFLGGLHRETSKVKAIADEATEILLIPVTKIGTLMKDNEDWLNYIFWLYHKRFEELLEVVNAVTFKKIDERLINLIKVKTEVLKSPTLSITHEQLANELGTARVVVSRLLKQMEEKKLVKLGRNKITLL